MKSNLIRKNIYKTLDDAIRLLRRRKKPQ